MTASMWREFTLHCDRIGCNTTFGPFGVERSRAALRRLAAKAGWTHVHDPGTMRRQDDDFCPEHKPAEADGQTAQSAGTEN